MKYSAANHLHSLDVIALAGSLRAGSLNRMLIAEAARIAPDGITVSVFDDVRDIPLFDADEEARVPDGPGAVAALRRLVRAADGLVIATPEYNQSIPAVTKNVVDWLSRPDNEAVLDGKPVAILGTTDGPWGTRYAQKELRHTLTAAGALVMPQPMFFLAKGQDAFDADGRMASPETERRLADLLREFERWVRLVGEAPELMALEA
ncbi:MAG: NADPH-dependent FMN reductase [Candidatus Limnocylindria bacterium]